MKHPSLSKNSAILINILLILILTISIILSSYSLRRNIQINNNEDVNNISNEIIGNIDQSRIIKENISNLELEWSLDMNTTRGLEATPIVDNGVMYVTNAWSIVHAIDAKTGKEKWFYDPDVPRVWSKKACCDVVNRGVAVWKGFVYSATLDGRLLKLDAQTGELIWEINTLSDRKLDYTI